MKYRFAMDLVVEADSVETALGDVSSHLATAARHIGSEVDPADVCQHFKITPVADDADVTDVLHDHVVAANGPIPLNLDPESDQGKAYAEQVAAEAESKRRASMTDAEALAEFAAKERAADPANQEKH